MSFVVRRLDGFCRHFEFADDLAAVTDSPEDMRTGFLRLYAMPSSRPRSSSAANRVGVTVASGDRGGHRNCSLSRKEDVDGNEERYAPKRP